MGAQFNVMPGTNRQRGGRGAGALYSAGTSSRKPGWAGALCSLSLVGCCRWSKPVGLCRAQVWAHLFLVRQDNGRGVPVAWQQCCSRMPSSGSCVAQHHAMVLCLSEGSPVVVVDWGCQAGVLSRLLSHTTVTRRPLVVLARVFAL